MDFSLSVHSAHLSCMNTASVFEKPRPNCLRLSTTICGPIFANMVIDNRIWSKPGCAPGTNDCIFWTISLIFVALRYESTTKPSSPTVAFGLTIHAIKLNKSLSKSENSFIQVCPWKLEGRVFFPDLENRMILNVIWLLVSYKWWHLLQ